MNGVNSKTLSPILEKNVCETATLNTDEFAAYRKLAPLFAKYEIVTHSKVEYVRGKSHMNTVECSFSLLKRGLIGTFHHAGEQHLQRHVTEFDFRWHHRTMCDSQRRDSLLSQTGGKRLMYRDSSVAA